MDWKSISRARRKLDREEGTIYKDWGGRIPVALAYPNSYYVGMSNLGMHAMYRLLNASADIVCERVFHEPDDRVPISLESQRPISEFAVLAFSLPFEMDYFNMVTMLRQARIPLSSQERDDSHPLLIAGGPCVMANPEPLAPVFDAFVIGEGEVVVPTLGEVLRGAVSNDRQELIHRLASVPGVYVPRFYRIERENDHISGISPSPGVPFPVQRQWLSDLDAHPTSSAIMTEDTEFGDMYLMEVTRGCERRCHFCLGGVTYLPMRERSLESLLGQAKRGLKYRTKLGLIGPSLSDYSRIEELARALLILGAEISVSSLRVDPLPEALLQALAESGCHTLTIAPEAGSERLRRKINKGISEEDIVRAVKLAAQYGFSQLKLYFMLGLPTETDDDVREIVNLVRAMRQLFRRQLTINVTPFVPKAQTPFQRVAMAPPELLEERLGYLKGNLRTMNVDIRAESTRWARIQGVLARGDRRVGEALMTVEKKSVSAWRRALETHGLRPDAYLGHHSKDEILPWASVSAGTGLARATQELAKETVQ